VFSPEISEGVWGGHGQWVGSMRIVKKNKRERKKGDKGRGKEEEI